jgi:hypothetical protein
VLHAGPFLILVTVAAYSLYALWQQGAVRRRERPPSMAVVVGAGGSLFAGLALAIVFSATGQSRPLADGYEAAHVLVAESAARTGHLTNSLGFTAGSGLEVMGSALIADDGEWTIAAPRGWAAVLTAVRWVGPAAIPVAAAALAGLLIPLTFLLAVQRLRPATAALVAGVVALSPVVWFSTRGLSAAVLAAVISVGGLWMFVVAASEGSIVRGAVAGFVVGTAALVSFEGWYLPVALIAYLLFEEAGSWHDSLVMRRRTRRFAAATAAASVGPLVLAGFDAVAIGRFDEVLVRFVPAAATVIAAGALIRLLWNTGLRPGIGRLREIVLALALVLAAGASYRLLRDPTGVDAVLEAANSLAGAEPVDALPASATPHLVFGWLRRQTGLLALLLGAIGLVWMGLASTRTRDPGLRVPMSAVLLAGGMTLAVPLAVPVQPDGLGILLPVVIPGLLIGAAFVIDRWWDRRGLGAAVAVAAGAALLVVPAWRLRDVAPLLPQDGAYAGVEEICDRVPPSAAVLVIEGPATPGIGRLLTPAVRSVCDAPAAYGFDDIGPAAYGRFLELAGGAGTPVYVLATEPFPLGADGPAVAKTGDFTYEAWVRTVTSFPEDTQLVKWPIGLAEAE